MRVAIIGLGSIGQRHARNVQALGHTVLPFDVDQTRGQHLAYLPNALDAAMICTPVATHAQVARDLLSIGFQRALFVEKPLAPSVADCAVFETWPHPNVMVGYNWRWNEDYWALDQVAEEHPAAVRVYRCLTNMAHWPGQHYGDPLLECSHEIDLALKWLGETAVVDAADVTEDGALIRLRVGRDRRALVELRWAVEDDEVARDYSLSTDSGSMFFVSPSATSIEASYVQLVRAFLTPTATATRDVWKAVRVLTVCAEAKAIAYAGEFFRNGAFAHRLVQG